MRLLTLIALCFAMGCGRPAAAPPDRITIEGLITADPLPAGFVVTRKDVKQAGEIRATNLAVAKTDSSTRAVVQIERRALTERPAQVAKVKGYLTAAATPWLKQGWTMKVRSLPNLETVDLSQPLVMDLDATKDGHKSVAIDIEIIFDKFVYEIESLSSDPAELETMMAWRQSVHPVPQTPATQPTE